MLRSLVQRSRALRNGSGSSYVRDIELPPPATEADMAFESGEIIGLIFLTGFLIIPALGFISLSA
jgi:hypothetical protein